MSNIDQYIKMQKDYYEDPNHNPQVQIVGNYGWHEQVPYEDYLLNRKGESKTSLFSDTRDKLALDFGCGPGRMVNRMSKLFKRVDGADISKRLVDICREKFPENNFYVTNGKSVGAT